MKGRDTMNQIVIGQFIALKRKEKNLTQGQLAEILNISNKTISKWETGKSMPEYSLINPLCEALDVTVSELLEGQKSYESINEKQLIDLVRKIQQLEDQKLMLYGIIFSTMGVSMKALAHTSGSHILSMCMLILSVVESLLGLGMIIKYLLE